MLTIKQILWDKKKGHGVLLIEPDCMCCGGSGMAGEYVYWDDMGQRHVEPEMCSCVEYIDSDRKDYYVVTGEAPPKSAHCSKEGGESPE